jgi:hypothetical protein
MHQARIISASTYPASQAEMHFARPASAYRLPDSYAASDHALVVLKGPCLRSVPLQSNCQDFYRGSVRSLVSVATLILPTFNSELLFFFLLYSRLFVCFLV